ncbi:HlyB/MsbA family ABC transporter [Nocardiopsis terrae]|uniref:ABC-type transport system involved in cytochrome bd biosynthesis fused ATPase/permease subunit n=1 Tax=Nocardiopsis terrae TaxID=372655 RepID=A0ABR9HFT1_9ACTN|nr:ATP-binding cassette domain-containing protein [Nocardiopsis terrae]MBE1457817.1 ABC-type transport system involved in cytochrome bd biosynthesis fused ATPase/permease subunit [Nocardiopsis terrae]GHC84113.1 HlyB/MsbA family ABC transporter [Nocardiopsis terrae]
MMIVPPLWREAARFPADLARSVALLVLVFLAHVGQAVAIAWSMSAVLRGQAQDVLLALSMILGIAMLRLVLSLAQASAAARLGGRVRQAVRRRAMEAALVPERLHDTAARDGSMRASLGDGVDGIDAYVSKYVPAIVQLLLTCPIVVVVLLVTSPWAGLCVAAGVLFALVGPMAWKRMMARRGLDHWDSYEALSADLLESLRGMATLRTLGDVSGTRERLQHRSEALRRATERVMRVSLGETSVTDAAVQGGAVAAAAVAVTHAVTGQAPALEVYLILLLSSEAFRPVRELSRHWHAGFLGLTAVPGLERIGALSERRTAAPGHTTSDPVSDPEGGPGSDRAAEDRPADVLRVRGLSFRYPDAPRDVIHDLDLTARRGSLTAVVGASGAGKSTLFDLLLGFLTPRTGSIDLDGRPLRARDIAVVSQRPVLFAGTVRDNLAVAGATAEADLVEACRDAGILDEVQRFPRGFDTEVTEAGTSLSGGQRQRLALARALLARSPVLLVDEPTSALDADRSADVVRTLHRVARDRVVLMISHRTETLTGVPDVLSLDSEHLGSTS